MKIEMFQSGGSTPPYVDYMPFEGIGTGSTTTTTKSSSSTSSSSNSSSSSSNDLGLKDVLNLLKGVDALPSDMEKIKSSVMRMYRNASLFNDGLISTNDLVRTYMSALLQVKYANFNKKEYEDAKKTVKDNGGYHEVAIDDSGKLFCLDKDTGEFVRLDIKDYFDNYSQYITLKNSDLLRLRSENKGAAFNNSFFDVVSNGVGEKVVTDTIHRAMSKIGVDELVKKGYTINQAGKIIDGLNLLEEAYNKGLLNLKQMTPDQLEEVGITSKDSQNKINMALFYVLKTMPENQKAWLRYKSGDTEDPDRGAINLISKLMFAGESHTTIVDLHDDTDSNGNKKSGKKGSGDKSAEEKSNPYISMQLNEGATYGRLELNTGTNNSMSVDGYVYSNLTDSDWNPIGNDSMADVLDKGLSGIVENMRGIAFGNTIVNREDLYNIMYDGGGAIKTLLPCKIVNGVKTVDLEVLTEFNKAKEEFDNLPKNQQTDKKLGEILENHGLNELTDNRGLPNKQRFGEFLIVTGYAVDKNHKFYKDKDFVEEVDTHNKSLMDLIKSTLSTDDKKSNYDLDTESWFETKKDESFWFTFDHVYKGNLYIPISTNIAKGHNAGKQENYLSVQNQREYQSQIEYKRRNANSDNDASQLNM